MGRSFLRRLFGPGDRESADDADEGRDAPDGDAAGADAAERTYELEVLRDEHARLDDLQQRQLRYEGYAWRLPAQGRAAPGGRRRRGAVSDVPRWR